MGSRNNIMFNLVLILKEVSILLSAYLPKTSEVILGSIQGGAEVFEVKKIQNLFPRIEKNK
jgi:hypothetical protein